MQFGVCRLYTPYTTCKIEKRYKSGIIWYNLELAGCIHGIQPAKSKDNRIWSCKIQIRYKSGVIWNWQVVYMVYNLPNRNMIETDVILSWQVVYTVYNLQNQKTIQIRLFTLYTSRPIKNENESRYKTVVIQ